MKACWWLLKREFWEHRRALLITLGTLLLVCIVFNSWALYGDFNDAYAALAKSHSLPKEYVAYLSTELRTGELWWIRFIVLRSLIELSGYILSLRFFLQTLSAERTGKNVMFWRSMPATDMQTVFAKLFFGTAAIPFFFLLTNGVAMLLTALSSAVFLSLRLNAAISIEYVLNFGVYSFFPLFGSYFLVVIAGVLTGGWLMLCSTLANRFAGLLAIMIPLLGLVMVTQVNMSYPAWASWLEPVTQFLVRLNLGLLPSALDLSLVWSDTGWDWRSFEKSIVYQFPPQQPDHIKLLTSPRLWISVVTGGIFTICAAHLRRFKSE